MSRELGDFLDTTPENLPSGVWIGLLQQAFWLLDGIHNNGIKAPFWTFGGGTVLMLRYQHRMSKDIDIFVPGERGYKMNDKRPAKPSRPKSSPAPYPYPSGRAPLV